MNRFSVAIATSKVAGGLALAALGTVAITPAAQAATPYSYFENFEDGLLNTPGVSVDGGSVLGPQPIPNLIDSVEGAQPGFGSTGVSYYSSGRRNLRFTFDEAVLGMLPTKAGITWTDVGFVFNDAGAEVLTNGNGENVVFKAFGASDNTLVTITRILGDGFFSGQTEEDSVFEYFFAGGIKAIEIGMPNSGDWEVDGLRYSAEVPTPALLPGLIGLGVGMWRKRKGEQVEQSS